MSSDGVTGSMCRRQSAIRTGPIGCPGRPISSTTNRKRRKEHSDYGDGRKSTVERVLDSEVLASSSTSGLAYVPTIAAARSASSTATTTAADAEPSAPAAYV